MEATFAVLVLRRRYLRRSKYLPERMPISDTGRARGDTATSPGVRREHNWNVSVCGKEVDNTRPS